MRPRHARNGPRSAAPARTVGAAAALAVLLATGASAAPGPVAARSGTGVAVPGIRILYSGPLGIDLALDRLAATGVGWLRVDAAWSELEGTAGRPDFTALDRLVQGARDRGLSLLLVLGTTAGWSRPPDADWNHGPTTAAEATAFARFAATVAERYRGSVAAYEVWNEPNLAGSWAPAPDPAAYLRLLTATYRAVRAADPAALVLSGGTGGGSAGIDTVAWYETLYAGGLAAISDAVAVHPYPEAPLAAGGELAKADRVRAVMDAHGDGAKPLWGTETGAPTGGAHAVDERQQAVLLHALYRQWAGRRGTGPLFHYTLDDFGGADREHHFGLFRADGTRKPAFAALRAHTR